MPKVKVPRKSTIIDMTAMCDVAFLLLSFFILTTKFKPDETLAVVTPMSVSSKAAPDKDVVLITIDKEGKVYFSVSDNNTGEKADIIDAVNTSRNLGLTDAEKKSFVRSGSFVGVPFGQLKSYLQKKPEDVAKLNQPGIPVTDTLNNELSAWITAAVAAFQGSKMELMVKGDNASKYPSFQGVINSFKKNDQMKFQILTDPEGVPEGSELYKKNQKGITD
jgi:biopolymer transport protein ExbD